MNGVHEGQASSPNRLTAWLSRLGWVAVGALAYAVFGPMLVGSAVSPAAAGAECPPGVEVTATAPAVVDPVTPPVAAKAPTARPPQIPVGEQGVALAPRTDAAEVRSPPVEPEAAPTSVPEAAPTPPGDAPDFPLPRMPGCNKLSSLEKFDFDKRAWVLTRAYEAPASTDLIVRFYRKALRDLDLELSEGKGAPAEDGSVRVFVKGRKDGAAAQVSIRQVPGEFDSRVRVIWRQWE